ncbi:hybrid sensor histidine kinase/response regulator [Roseibium suaedae]|uniref:histidine kinase n=1 Tax=Roseibium suaedae TaxID=735517 RepID=A0A1M7PFE0_9HYPH|nr:PAS-domain containing protein [Roseibium suaedae]SHN15726.1 Signal transduction histidine kinase [Roseibium suaedae]
MIDPQEPLEVQVERQAKIIDALIQRATREDDIGGSAYSLFQSAIALQGEVWEKNRELERALDTLGRASNQLRIAEFAREQTQRNLADALEAMEGGFALFSDSELEICNNQFKRLVPDIAEVIIPGLRIEDYLDALYHSKEVTWDPSAAGPAATRGMGVERSDGSIVPPVFGLRGDRWYQITHKRASDRKVVLLSTEITSVVRQSRFEKDRLIDEQARFVQAAFDHMTQGVCTFSAEGSLLIHNERFRELLRLPVPLVRKGTAVAQILDFILRNNLLSSPDPVPELARWAAEIRTGQGLKKQVRHLSGEILDIRIHGLPDKGYIMNVMDITAEVQTTQMLEQRVQERTLELTRANERLQRQNEEQVRIDEQLRIAKEQAEDAMRSKTRFFAAASHDLLQPINAAKLLISHLSEHAGDLEIGDTVKRLDRSFVSIESLLHALLDISRLDSTGTEMSVGHFCLGDLMIGAREAYAGLAEEKGLRLDVVPSSLWVRSDQRYLSRSIQNLVVNAIQYTSSGRVLVGCRRHGRQVVLEVWDTGIGISKKDQQRIFSEFTRVTSDGAGFGMGLGLSIVDRACRRLGHPVAVRSKPGIGSVFSITLPVVAQDPANVFGDAEDGSFPAEDLDLIVLIVENNPDVLFATTRKVESWGASVLTAASTEEALAQVRELGMAPDIILADYQLDGDDNGIKTIQALRRETGAHIPAVMITASREDTLAADSKQHDFTILTKPVQLSRLRPLIDWKTSSVRQEEDDEDEGA